MCTGPHFKSGSSFPESRCSSVRTSVPDSFLLLPDLLSLLYPLVLGCLVHEGLQRLPLSPHLLTLPSVSASSKRGPDTGKACWTSAVVVATTAPVLLSGWTTSHRTQGLEELDNIIWKHREVSHPVQGGWENLTNGKRETGRSTQPETHLSPLHELSKVQGSMWSVCSNYDNKIT